MSSFTPGQMEAITVIQYTVGSISIFGLAIVIMLIILSGRMMSFRYRIIFYLLFSDLLTAISIVFGRMTYLKKHMNACAVTAYIMQFGALSSMTWTCILAFSLQRITSKLSWNISWKTEIIYWILGWGPSTVTLIMMKTLNLQGPAVFYCWIQDKGLYRFYFLYIPFVIMLFINITCFLLTIFKKKNIWKQIDRSDHIASSSETIDSIERTIHLIIAVILIQTLCWVPAFVNRLAQQFGVYNTALEFIQIFAEPLEGTLNASFYAYQLIRGCSRKNTKVPLIEKNHNINYRFSYTDDD